MKVIKVLRRHSGECSHQVQVAALAKQQQGKQILTKQIKRVRKREALRIRNPPFWK